MCFDVIYCGDWGEDCVCDFWFWIREMVPLWFVVWVRDVTNQFNEIFSWFWFVSSQTNLMKYFRGFGSCRHEPI